MKAKRLISTLLVAVLALAMMVPAFAAEIDAENEVNPAAIHHDTLPVNTNVRLTPLNCQSQDLNILGYDESQITSGRDVTTWPTIYGDPLHSFMFKKYEDGTCRLVSRSKPGYAVEYYHGRNNPGNAQMYWYNIADNSSTYANDCTLIVHQGVNDQWRFQLKYYPTLWLTCDPNTKVVDNTTIHNVCWKEYDSNNRDQRSWYVHVD